MVIGFKEKFKEPILKGTKIHTIREDSHNRWKQGIKMHMATGVRTKKYNQFYEDTCKSTQKIEIKYNKGGGVNVFIDNNFFHYQTSWGLEWEKESKNRMLKLAINDGFDSIESFFKWFNGDFVGKIIHWTDLIYPPPPPPLF